MSRQSPLEPINRHFVPSILPSNVMSLVPKVDIYELALVVGNHNPDIICITETWLKKQIPDDVVQINNYTLLLIYLFIYLFIKLCQKHVTEQRIDI
jgi:hypothetical protein